MLIFITGNANKAAEVERLLGFALERQALELAEVQAVELAPVVRHKAQQAYTLLQRPVLVEDTGLSFAAWNGLPGALIKWFLLSLGTQGICRLLRNETNRQATATTLFGYHDGTHCQVFTGTVAGLVPDAPRGAQGFGWDAIFQPDGSQYTFAEMTAEQKDRFSMRRLALEQLRDSGLFAQPV